MNIMTPFRVTLASLFLSRFGNFRLSVTSSNCVLVVPCAIVMVLIYIMSFIHDKTGQRETHFIKRTFTVYTGDEKHVLLSHFNLGNIQISRKKEHLPQ